MDGPFHFHAAKLHRFLQTIDCKLYKHLAFFKKYIANCTEALQIIQKKKERNKKCRFNRHFLSLMFGTIIYIIGRKTRCKSRRFHRFIRMINYILLVIC